MRVIFDGETIDVMDDDALAAAAERRTQRFMQMMTPDEAHQMLSTFLATLAPITIKLGAVSAFYQARRDLHVDIDMIAEVSDVLHMMLGLNAQSDDDSSAAIEGGDA